MNLRSKTYSKDNPAFQLLFMASQSAKLLEGLPTNGEIEVVIFNAILAKKFLWENSKILYNQIHDEYDKMVYGYLIEMGLESKVPDMYDFIPNRMSFYIEKIQDLQLNSISKIYYLFYENPLAKDIKPTVNFEKIMKFQIVLMEMVKTLKKTVALIN